MVKVNDSRVVGATINEIVINWREERGGGDEGREEGEEKENRSDGIHHKFEI